MPERSEDFKILNHILSKRYGFTQIGMNNSARVYFENKHGDKTQFIDREDSFSPKYLIELSDQIKINSDQLIEVFNALKQLLDK